MLTVSKTLWCEAKSFLLSHFTRFRVWLVSRCRFLVVFHWTESASTNTCLKKYCSTGTKTYGIWFLPVVCLLNTWLKKAALQQPKDMEFCFFLFVYLRVEHPGWLCEVKGKFQSLSTRYQELFCPPVWRRSEASDERRLQAVEVCKRVGRARS